MFTEEALFTNCVIERVRLNKRSDFIFASYAVDVITTLSYNYVQPNLLALRYRQRLKNRKVPWPRIIVGAVRFHQNHK